MSNSSGSVERFLLGAAESKQFETLTPGGNTFVIDIANGLNQGIDGLLSSGGNASVVVALQTSEDGVTYTTVGSAITVVPGGKGALHGNVGKFAKILNSGAGLASIVAKPLHRIQVKTNL